MSIEQMKQEKRSQLSNKMLQVSLDSSEVEQWKLLKHDKHGKPGRNWEVTYISAS